MYGFNLETFSFGMWELFKLRRGYFEEEIGTRFKYSTVRISQYMEVLSTRVIVQGRKTKVYTRFKFGQEAMSGIEESSTI